MAQKNTVLLTLYYLPCIDYFDCIHAFENIILEYNEFYLKQSYRNRCYILGANKIETLSIPIQESNKKKLIREVRIDNSVRWAIIHWRTIEAAYRKSPYFEYFADQFLAVYNKKHDFLWEFNLEMLKICFKLLKIQKPITLTEYYETMPDVTIFDARTLFNSKRMTEETIFRKSRTYHQNFGDEFVPNLSIIDLLFCKFNQNV